MCPKGELYVVSFDYSGGFITDYKLDYDNANPIETSGTNIIYNEATDVYIVGGLEADVFTYPLASNNSVLIELDGNLQSTNKLRLNSNSTRHSSINDIVQVNGDYFITGSVGLQGPNIWSPQQGVLAMFIGGSFSVLQDVSFESTMLYMWVYPQYMTEIIKLFI